MELNQGQCDSPLTQTGITQANTAKKWFELQDIHFDAVYSSTSERACDTAEIVSGGMPYIRRKGLKEIFLGTKEATPVSTNPEYPYEISLLHLEEKDCMPLLSVFLRKYSKLLKKKQGRQY